MKLQYFRFIFLATVALSGCDKIAPATANNDFDVTTKHDSFDGDKTTARKDFSNSDGIQAQVKLTCAADEKKSNTDSWTDFGMSFAMAAAGMADGAQTGCPKGYQCGIIANVVVSTRDGSPASLVAKASPGVFQLPIAVPYQGKNGDDPPYNAITALTKVGSSFASNSTSFLVPTSGTALTEWQYRFRAEISDQPIDLLFDYAAPEFSKFVASCNSKMPPPINPGSSDAAQSPASPATTAAAPNSSDADAPATTSESPEAQLEDPNHGIHTDPVKSARGTPYSILRQTLLDQGWQPLPVPGAQRCTSSWCADFQEFYQCSDAVEICDLTWMEDGKTVEVQVELNTNYVPGTVTFLRSSKCENSTSCPAIKPPDANEVPNCANSSCALHSDDSLPFFPDNEPYSQVRTALLGSGWIPYTSKTADTCDEDWCKALPEIDSCAGDEPVCDVTWQKGDLLIQIDVDYISNDTCAAQHTCGEPGLNAFRYDNTAKF